MRVKDYCYALRTALSASYIVENRMLPPPDIQNLAMHNSQANWLVPLVNDLVRQKSLGTESMKIQRITKVDDLIGTIMAADAPALTALKADINQANRLFRSIITE